MINPHRADGACEHLRRTNVHGPISESRRLVPTPRWTEAGQEGLVRPNAFASRCVGRASCAGARAWSYILVRVAWGIT